MLHAIRLAGLSIKIAVLNELQYRANFFVSLLSSTISLVTGIAVLAVLFDHVSELNGWDPPELLAVLGIFTILGGFIRTLVRPNLARFMEEVREGTLDYVLTKPVNALLLVSIRTMNVWQAADVVAGALVLGTAVIWSDAEVGWLGLFGLLLGLLLGMVMVYCCLLILAMSAFWFIRADSVMVLFDAFYQAGRWPVAVYPGWLRLGLTVVVPVGFAVSVPADAITGRLGLTTLAAAVAYTAVLLAITAWLWRLGLRRYSGASS